MADLFDTAGHTHEPLAARMRPRTLDEYVGQDHIVGKGRLLRRAIAADQLTSVIFYGPPGSGKTTLARVIANHTKSNFLTLNAVLTGVADIRRAISDADDQRRLYNKKTILFVDEVHRWNKSQQDALLPWVENGTIILIGATTENPFFEVNKALVSRSRVFQLKALTTADLLKAAHQALSDTERGYGHWQVTFEDGALEHLVETANGDARSLLNALELAVETTPERWAPDANPPVPSWGSTIYISKETAEESIQKKAVLYDRDGDYHYDIISAFIKSLRGRDPDAACYWLSRMVKAGEDPHFIFRRMLISACEDTGLADPTAITVVQSCAAAFDRVGFPEGNYFLAHAALYLSTAPKSNSSMAFFDAMAAVEKEDADVPNHLKDASRDAEGFGHGAGYLYPHAYRDHWVAQQYLPDALVGRVFYTPGTQGYEARIREEVLSRREIQIASLLEEQSAPDRVNPVSGWWTAAHFKGGNIKKEENLTFSPDDKRRSAVLDKAERSWRSRLDTNRAQVLTRLREDMLNASPLLRHHRSLVWSADDMLLLFDVLRRTPEGATCGLCRTQEGLDLVAQYGSTLGEIERPLLSLIRSSPRDGTLVPETFRESIAAFGDMAFDRMYFRDIIASPKDIAQFFALLHDAFCGSTSTKRDIAFSEDDTLNKDRPPLLSETGTVVLSQRIPCHGQRLSRLLSGQIEQDGAKGALSAEAAQELSRAEDAFFSDASNPLFSWNAGTLAKSAEAAGLSCTVTLSPLTEKRRISDADIARWLDGGSAYGSAIRKAAGDKAADMLKDALSAAAETQLFDWTTENALLTIRKFSLANSTDP